MSNTTAEKKQLQGVFALWKRTSKDGKKTFFSGQTEDKSAYLTAFYNTNKKNLKEPDLRVYMQDGDGDFMKDDEGKTIEYCSLWVNATKKGEKKYLSGKVDGKRVVGFIRENATEKQPYISVYFSDEQEKPKKQTKAKKSEPEQEDLPF